MLQPQISDVLLELVLKRQQDDQNYFDQFKVIQKSDINSHQKRKNIVKYFFDMLIRNQSSV
jgi:hypothetical protein